MARRHDNGFTATRRTVLAAAVATAAAGTTVIARANSPSAGSRHVTLLGDSILDNKAYVGDGPDVTRHLQDLAPPSWRITRAARDGAVISDISDQLAGSPTDTTHLILSVGGNDALQWRSVFDQPAESMSEALHRLHRIRADFADSYAAMLDAATRRNIPVAICTIYDCAFEDPSMRVLATIGLTIFNDCILRQAAARGLDVLDLRLICDEPEDYSNEIEPSVAGGAKIAAAILAFAGGQSAGPRTQIIGGLA